MDKKLSYTRFRRGATMLYASVVAAVLFGMTSLAVDYGHAQLAKTEMQRAITAAARYAVSGLNNGTAVSKAISAAAENTVDGSPMVLTAADVQVGNWSNNTFTATSLNPNAIQITGYRNAARNNAVKLFFAAAIGKNSIDITSTVVASLGTTTASNVTSTTTNVAGNSSVWYAGMASGSHITDTWGYDTVGGDTTSSLVSGITLQPNAILTFTATGSVDFSTYDSSPDTAPAGNPTWMNSYCQQAQTPWMAGITAPGMGLVGVFVDDTPPSAALSAPPALDYSASSNYTSQTPQLRQPFFIGNGKNADGSDKKIVVPAGATKLYMGPNDSWIWRDNAGSFTVSTTQTSAKVITVK